MFLYSNPVRCKVGYKKFSNERAVEKKSIQIHKHHPLETGSEYIFIHYAIRSNVKTAIIGEKMNVY